MGIADRAQGVRSRYAAVSQQQSSSMVSAPLGVSGVDDGDDEYEPDFEPAEDDEQILNKLDDGPSEMEPVASLGPFNLPPPPPLTEAEAERIGQGTIARVFGIMSLLESGTPASMNKVGVNRLAASSYDRDAWITVITRLATRASAGLDSPAVEIKSEHADALPERKGSSMSDSIRETLYRHIVEDFRNRINTAIAWLNEEWYNDRIQLRHNDGAEMHYEKWVLKVLDGILPYLDARDKVFTRFLSEIPSMSGRVLDRVKGLARDPERVALAVNSLQ